jgi:uncharacterized protein with FMN-binding domain
VLALVVFGVSAYFYVQSDLQKLAKIEITDVDLSKIDDGVYRGESSHFPVIVSVEVTIQNHRMTSILLLKHMNGQGASAESILDDVLSSQSLDVDVISGATYSSQAILQAISRALGK